MNISALVRMVWGLWQFTLIISSVVGGNAIKGNIVTRVGFEPAVLAIPGLAS